MIVVVWCLWLSCGSLRLYLWCVLVLWLSVCSLKVWIRFGRWLILLCMVVFGKGLG